MGENEGIEGVNGGKNLDGIKGPKEYTPQKFHKFGIRLSR
jgi:hypothetical protein